MNTDTLSIDAGAQFRTTLLHAGGRILWSFIFSPKDTIREFKSFSVQEHVDRVLNDGFIRKKVQRTIWELLVLTAGVAVLHSIGEVRRLNKNLPRRKKRSAEYDDDHHGEIFEHVLSNLAMAASTLD